MEDLRELLTSAMTKPNQGNQNQQHNPNASRNILLGSLTKGGETSPSPTSPTTILRKPSASLKPPRPSPADAQIACPNLVSIHMPIANFKKVTDEEGFSPQLVSANEKYIAYVVSRKKVRLLDQISGQKGRMDNQKDSNGPIVAIGMKDDILASLTEDGELLIGSVYPESAESLNFDPIVSLTFPDLQPSRGLVWAQGEKQRCLAAWGKNPAAFMVWLEPKPQALEIPHSLEGPVEAVAFFGEGKFVAVADLKCVECFKVDHGHKSFTKIAQLSFGGHVDFSRIMLFEDKENDFVIGAIDNSLSGTFMACPVNIGKDLAWITSSLKVKDAQKTCFTYDPLLEVFLVDSRDGTFTVLGFRSDMTGFALIDGSWKESLPVLSMNVSSGLRNIEAGIHVPVYVFQSEWVSFYGLKLPSDPQETPIVAPQVVAPKETLKPVLTSPSLDTMFIPASNSSVSSSAKLETEVREIVRSILMQSLVPSLEASFKELFAQVKNQIATITASENKSLEAKVDQLTAVVNDLKKTISELPSAQQLAEAVMSPLHHGSGENLALAPAKESFDDLMKKELDELVSAGLIQAALVKALELGNLHILTWLLARLDAASTIDLLPTPVILSLAQQLGADLSSEPELKLDWLADIFTTYTPPTAQDPTLAGTAGEVLEEIFANLRVLFAELPAESPLVKKVKVVMRLVRMAL